MRPATPLPWRLFENGATIEISPPAPARLGERPSVVGWTGFDSSDMKLSEQRANARYIVHSANAYEKLVEALRSAPVDGPHPADERGPCLCSPCSFRRLRAALLRELGEGEMKPGSPLPWELEGDPKWMISSVPADTQLRGVATTNQVTPGAAGLDVKRLANAAYIVHVANAYPKMVEVLRQIAKPAIGGKLQQYAAQALLRNIGEKP